MATKAGTLTPSAPVIDSNEREATFDIFRRWGYLQASLDPLGQYLPPEPFPTPAPEGESAVQARSFYCGTIAAEFMHIADPERRQWLQEQMEQAAPKQNQKQILTQLIRADLFEQVIQSRYLGTKRFSLEGLTVLIPFLDRVFEASVTCGVTKAILAMSHRGRLNVMTNTIGRSAAEIFTKFEDVDPRSTMGGGDVKYHMGATGDYVSPDGKTIALHLVSNPSHLEAVDPVALGRARAKQERIGKDGEAAVLPLIMHGDAAFAGQGILAETLNMATLPGYRVGGTIHVIVNNLLGFTAVPEESNSSRFATDIAKRLPIPIFHVNAEDPDAVIRVAGIAAEYRHRFRSDIVVDLVGYRKHGHSEVDDPTVTQPRRYAIIKDRAPLYQLYAKQVGVDPAAEVQAVQAALLEDQKTATKADHIPHLSQLPDYWNGYRGGELQADDEPKTGLPADKIAALAHATTKVPEGFHLHPKLKKLFEQREEMGSGSRPFDYGMAELVAYASLLETGTPVRLTGQDSQRGTFNQRHAVMVDTETEVRYIPLANMSKDQGKFEVYNSLLSEAAVLGFDYGFSRDYPEALVLWEAQFGDFANGAQIIIDQFISASEAKWGLLSGIAMLLPHGYEGQGPEHSSARIERFLQLAAYDNMQICQPSTAAQYFHLLRRQSMRKWRKPLVVFTPKSMLRHPDASSSVADFAEERFQNVLPDHAVQNPRRLLVCSGKIGHNLRVEREKRKDMGVAIIFVEQLFPWPETELQAALDEHPDAEEIVWVQEEPANMGAFSYVMPELRRMAGQRAVLSVKRTAAASPATGSAKAHEMEERTLIDLAFGV
ncbi:2-oxoglutarate dehydrogenase E1 component [Granulicella sp. dw_53]|uniref:2-oxoglutarate dehydrogenase E1 component n=1 Tax=Granulicella sp. dw_53 TaxID=2719792 RepID=UPI001BD66DD3|nr:2-oxoglutarate dehydrogenase E1 component [Granulicella sp. dw_53]